MKNNIPKKVLRLFLLVNMKIQIPIDGTSASFVIQCMDILFTEK